MLPDNIGYQAASRRCLCISKPDKPNRFKFRCLHLWWSNPMPIQAQIPYAAAALLAFGTPALAESEGPFSERAVATFIAADINNDEHLSFDEFGNFIRIMAAYGQPTSRRIRTFGAYRMAFNRIDVNDDGYVSPNEMRSADRSHRAEGG
jgi:hypothetical protein